MPGCATGGLAAGHDRRAAELAQPFLKLAVSVLQFLVLAGELPQLALEPLDPHIRVGIVPCPCGGPCGTFPWKRDLREGGLRRQGSIAAIATAPVALRNLDDILP